MVVDIFQGFILLIQTWLELLHKICQELFLFVDIVEVHHDEM